MKIKNEGRPVSLKDCPAGLFMVRNVLCIKTRFTFTTNSLARPRTMAVAYNQLGDVFHDDGTLVQPVTLVDSPAKYISVTSVGRSERGYDPYVGGMPEDPSGGEYGW